jgi:hypothetical protein
VLAEKIGVMLLDMTMPVMSGVHRQGLGWVHSEALWRRRFD